jgi:hypothetical protein
VATHQSCHRLEIKGFSEKFQIISFLLFADQFCPKSSQGHIGDSEKMGEGNAKAPTQLAPVIFFKNRL